MRSGITGEYFAITLAGPAKPSEAMKPGSTVVCIDDQFRKHAKSKLCAVPRKGQEYVVSGIFYSPEEIVPPALRCKESKILKSGSASEMDLY
jgi:hypothetical protein